MVGLDVGERRIGVAISDATRTLARPVAVLAIARLDGSPTTLTQSVQTFATQLGARTGLPVAFQDERLTSVEAESRLAERDKDWRSRKKRLDAAAAAIILQDHLDGLPR